MSDWNMVAGKREDLLREIQSILSSPDSIAEIRVARETVEIHDGPYLAEIAPTGRVRIELIVHEK